LIAKTVSVKSQCDFVGMHSGSILFEH